DLAAGGVGAPRRSLEGLVLPVADDQPRLVVLSRQLESVFARHLIRLRRSGSPRPGRRRATGPRRRWRAGRRRGSPRRRSGAARGRASPRGRPPSNRRAACLAGRSRSPAPAATIVRASEADNRVYDPVDRIPSAWYVLRFSGNSCTTLTGGPRSPR